jgi:hypothetical protein
MFFKVFLGFIALSVAAFGADFTGLWNLNAAKSKFNNVYLAYTMKVEMPLADTYHITYKVVGKDQKAEKLEMYVTLDGKERAMTGAPKGTTEFSERTGPNSWKTTVKMNGQISRTVTSEITADGRSQLVTAVSSAGSGMKRVELFSWDRVDVPAPPAKPVRK